MTYLIRQMPATVMADTVQEQLFALMGSTRTPFRGISRWPWLDDLLQGRAGEIIEQDGEAAWVDAGGVRNSQGVPTLDLQSESVEEILQQVEHQHGGLLWQDSHGVAWAMKLGTILHNGRRSRCGYAITWWRQQPSVLDPLAREQCYDRAVEKWESKEALERLAEDLQLFRRAEQLLWLTHAQVLAQRSSLVMIPDVTVAEVIWGERSRWPRNWRRDLERAFNSLTGLHSEAFRFVGRGWQPRWQAHSVALGHVGFVPESSMDSADRCPPACPLHNSAERHNHYRVQVGYGFLGVLEKYMIERVDDLRHYDFTRDPEGEVRQELEDKRQEGRIITTSLPLKVFAPARWSGLPRREQHLLAGLVRETTRSKNGKNVWEVRHGRVVGTRPKEITTCPFLATDQTYIVFGGNGHRRGCGYRIVGESRTGWLTKCGCDCEDQDQAGLRSRSREWLAGLGELQNVLGLVPVGLDPATGVWFDLETMQGFARRKMEWQTLNRLHVRVYAPLDYEARLRRFLADQGGLSEVATPPEDNPGPAFAERMARLGLRQQELANHLGTSRPYVNKLLNGEKWPAERVHQVENWLAEKEGHR